MQQRTERARLFLIYSGLVLITIVAFESVGRNDFISLDDYGYVTQNRHVLGGITRESVIWAFSTPHGDTSYWQPLAWLSHMLDCQLFGLDARWHHLHNVILHVGAVLLLFWVLKYTTGAVWCSAFVAAVFAVHPLRVESVAWVAERKDVLSVFFWMLTMAAYAWYAARPGTKRYLLVFLPLCLGLMAKPMLVTLPFALLLMDYWPLFRFRWKSEGLPGDLHEGKSGQSTYQISSPGRLIAEKVPLIIIALVASAVTFVVVGDVGARADSLPLKLQISNALVSYVRYIGKIFYPARLAVFYPYPRRGFAFWQPAACFVILAGMTTAVIYLGRRYRYAAVGWFWYLGTLGPVIGLVQAGSQAMADRFTYVPSIGILIVVAWGAAELLSKWRYRSVVLPIAASLLLGAMLVCTRNQVRLWKDNLTLFGHTLAVTENNPIIENSYACALFEDGKLDEAVAHLEKALRISPGFALYCNNLGRVLLKQGKVDKAISCFNQVLHTKKDLPDVHYYLGLAKVKQGRDDDAIRHFNEALRLKRDYVEAHLQMAYSLFRVGRIQPAIEHFHRVLQLHADHIEALNALAWVLATSNDTDEQKSAEAVRLAERACEITGYRNAEALDTLAAAYASAGKFPDAIKTAEQAIDAARTDGKRELAQEIQDRLQLYRSGQRYREK